MGEWPTISTTSKATPLLDRMWQLAGETREQALEGLSAAERQHLMLEPEKSDA